jgi:hypothetical protein
MYRFIGGEGAIEDTSDLFRSSLSAPFFDFYFGYLAFFEDASSLGLSLLLLLTSFDLDLTDLSSFFFLSIQITKIKQYRGCCHHDNS